MEKLPRGLKVITVIFFVLAILSFFTVIFGLMKINHSIFWGRIWGLLWTILYGIIFYGLLTKTHRTRNLPVIAYILIIISSIFSGSFKVATFVVICWSIIYLPSIHYLNKPEVKKLFMQKKVDSKT